MQETMQQYVQRKLNERAFNISTVIRDTKVSRATIYRIMEGKECMASTLQTLNDFFRKIGE